jgi:hypothetical protein
MILFRFVSGQRFALGVTPEPHGRKIIGDAIDAGAHCCVTQPPTPPHEHRLVGDRGSHDLNTEERSNLTASPLITLLRLEAEAIG